MNDFVDALGGTGAVAQLLGITPTAVQPICAGVVPFRRGSIINSEGIARARRLRLNKSMFWPRSGRHFNRKDEP